MRGVLALILTMSGIYLGNYEINMGFSGYINKTKSAVEEDASTMLDSFTTNRQGNTREPLHTHFEEHDASSAATSSRQATLPGRFTVNNLVGACAYDCSD